MMPHGQLGQSQTQPAFFDASIMDFQAQSLLANERIQIPARITPADASATIIQNSVVPAYPAIKLGLLKKSRFRAEGREKRIEVSLKAIDALSPTTLTTAQWIEIVEDVDDED